MASFLLLLLLAVVLASQSTSPGPIMTSSSQLTLSSISRLQVPKSPGAITLASSGVVQHLLLNAGIEANPGPYMCQLCREYTTDHPKNLTRHLKFYCSRKGDIPDPGPPTRTTRATKRKFEEEEPQVLPAYSALHISHVDTALHVTVLLCIARQYQSHLLGTAHWRT